MRRIRETPPQRVIIADPGTGMVVEITRRPGRVWAVRSREFWDQTEHDFERAIAMGHDRLDRVTGR